MLLPILISTLLTLAIAALLAITLRLQQILPSNRSRPQRCRGLSLSQGLRSRKPSITTQSRRLEKAGRDGFDIDVNGATYPYKNIMIVLGSGGHTAEMLLMLQDAGLQKWRTRRWVVSEGDGFSAQLAAGFEKSVIDGMEEERYDIIGLPRARRVHQSFLTAPWTSLQCLWSALNMLRGEAPDIILTNGPGTGVIIVLASLILRFFAVTGNSKTRMVYVESLARCKSLSLSGRLLSRVVDRFMVQWRDLEVAVGGRAEYKGAFALDAAGKVGMSGVGEAAVGNEGQWITFEV